MLIGDGALIPAMVIGTEVTTVETGKFVCDTNENGSGVMSALVVVTLNVALMPPMSSKADCVAPNVGDESTCTTTLAPLLTKPGALVKLPPFTA